MLVLVLTRDTALMSDSSVTATLLTGATAPQLRYRTAESFVMRRARDGAEFAWIPRPQTDTASVALDHFTNNVDVSGNLRLPSAGIGPRLGWTGLEPGESYDLDVVSEGIRFTGRTVLPGRPAPRVGPPDAAGTRVVSWSPVVGAAGYTLRFLFAQDTAARAELRQRVSLPTVPILGARSVQTACPGGRSEVIFVQTDTLFRVPEKSLVGPPLTVRVIALDTNLTCYLTDSTRARSGLSGALGVFGGASASPYVSLRAP
jgi:hypothetical protein